MGRVAVFSKDQVIALIEHLRGSLEHKIDQLSSMGGVGPSTPIDGQTSALIDSPNTLTRFSLETVIKSVVGSGLLDSIYRKNTDKGVHLEQLGAYMDGVKDDSDAVDRGLMLSASMGVPLIVPQGKRILLSKQISMPSGASINGNGSTFYWTQPTNPGTWLINANSKYACTVSDLTLEVETPVNADQRGVTAVNAVGFQLSNVKIRATNPGAGAGSNNKMGLLIQKSTAVNIDDVSIENFDIGLRYSQIKNFIATNIQVDNYRLGLWVSDCINGQFYSGRIKGKGPNTTQDPGHNGILVDTDSKYGTNHITFADYVVEDSGATGYRLGGQNPIGNVFFIRCKAYRAGSNGFKTLGGTVESKSRHRYVHFIDCFAEDSGLGGGTNTYGIAVHLTDDVNITNFICNNESASNSAYYGIDVCGSNRVTVTNPSIYRPLVAGIAVRTALGDVADCTIDGGRFITSGGADTFLFDFPSRTLRRINIRNFPAVEHYTPGYVIRINSDSSSSVIGGISAEYHTTNNTSVTNHITGSDPSLVHAEIKGQAPSDLTYAAFADTSRWYGRGGSRAFGIMKGRSWTWL